MRDTIALPVAGEPDRACSVCKIVKPAEAFHRAGPGKRKSRCAVCRAANRPPQTGKRRRGRPPLASRSNHLRRNYGITVGQYESMLASQGGGCAICGKPPTGNALAVDHCHVSGRVRALLCSACNRSLGYYEYVREDAEMYMAKYGRGNPLLGYDL